MQTSRSNERQRNRIPAHRRFKKGELISGSWAKPMLQRLLFALLLQKLSPAPRQFADQIAHLGMSRFEIGLEPEPIEGLTADGANGCNKHLRKSLLRIEIHAL